MRILDALLYAMLASIALSSCAYQRMGSLTMASTRNVDASKHYELLARNVSAKVDNEENALQSAIDQAVNSRPGGEYMMNVAISTNGHHVKLTGDVWGIPQTEGVAPAAVTGAATDLKIGDKVLVKIPGHYALLPGTIIGLQPDKAVVQYAHGTETRTKAVDFNAVTKVAQ